ncbi:ornithine carbamoyltransferase [Methanococcoides burtonii]|uniref:Ornithine carbamoyltransferase n=1 Tax=Methanococcoides burtonii (strain DSM 6242 / NBRC 107633 / OCM 468 / ACE-M) TaxID=259564 RepID=Q12X36_METBU|nr:ornithine carbamoyltransferase [Methanococcoides burtonii]ABE51990.1 Ornithine carbamoyltransferase [Methanococcoides burtonii DSM 6242]
MKHLISMTDLTQEEIIEILDMAEDLKEKRLRGKMTDLLKNKSLAMIFEKSSTRTRVSFEVAMSDLGGHSIYLNSRDIQIGRGETVSDTAQVLSRYVAGITARVNSHRTVEDLAKHSNVPVINALSDLEHPCQILADFLTIREYKNRLNGLKFAWIGDGNNVCNSLILGCALVGMQIAVACPEGYMPNPEIVAKGRELGGDILITTDPEEAAADADVLYADVWVSMGDEEEREKRLSDLENYQINSNLVELAKPDVIFMHCLPAHRGEEVSAEVMDGPHSVVFDQAENRLHAQKALLMKLMA